MHLAGTVYEDEEAEMDGRVKAALVLGALILPMAYGAATCEFDNCKEVFGVGIGLDLLLILVLFTGFG